MKMVRVGLGVIAALMLGGCGLIPVSVDQVDRTLDCFFLPIDHKAEDCKGGSINAADLLALSLTGTLYHEAGDLKKDSSDASIKNKRLHGAMKAWDCARHWHCDTNSDAKDELSDDQKVRLRVLRGFYVYAYLARLAANEAQRNAADGRDVAIRTFPHLKSGLAVLDRAVKADGSLSDETLYYGHTRKMEIFFDGFEAAYEAQAATATRVVKFFWSLGDTVDPLSAIERIRLGARFAFEQATLRAYASALQLDLIQTAIAMHSHGEGQTDQSARNAHEKEKWGQALKQIKEAINEYCHDLGTLAGLPKGDDRRCLKAAAPPK